MIQDVAESPGVAPTAAPWRPARNSKKKQQRTTSAPMHEEEADLETRSPPSPVTTAGRDDREHANAAEEDSSPTTTAGQGDPSVFHLQHQSRLLGPLFSAPEEEQTASAAPTIGAPWSRRSSPGSSSSRPKNCHLRPTAAKTPHHLTNPRSTAAPSPAPLWPAIPAKRRPGRPGQRRALLEWGTGGRESERFRESSARMWF
jgi:hypothetical protein